MARYRASAPKRWRAEARALDERYQRAWRVVRNVAQIVKDAFGATRILAFGSLVNKNLFHPNSDIDLAAWGVDETRYFRAVGQLLSIDPEMEIDLVMAEDARPALLRRIENEGVAV